MSYPIPFNHRLFEPLASFTTWRIGGPADILILPASISEFQKAVLWARGKGFPLTILAGGSNVLVADDGVEGVVILTTGFARIEAVDPGADGCPGLYCDAGAAMSAVCREAARLGLSGLETFSGLPGTIGGAVFMNARCYERAIAEVVDSVIALSTAGHLVTRSVEQCGFDYKQSTFQNSGELVTGVWLRLAASADPERVRADSEIYRERRVSAGQYLLPNAGCVFKNDRKAGLPSGKIIDQCGLRGYRAGRVQVFERHANFVVNLGGATAAEVLKVIRHIERTVEAETGFRLEREIRLLGRWKPEDLEGPRVGVHP